MKIRALLFRNSMTLVVTSVLLLFLFSTSCMGSHYEDCLNNVTTCGGIEFGYPFGLNGSGCGEPDFQLNACDNDGVAQINMGGNQYHILESSFLGNSSIYKILRILNDNLWGGKCNLSGNYSQFWWSNSYFQILDTYNNLTLWKNCDQFAENIYGNLSLCGDDWYYSLSPHLNIERTHFCNAFQLPIKQNLSQQPIITDKTLAEGFDVHWQVDPNGSRKPRDGTQGRSHGEDTGSRSKSGIVIGTQGRSHGEDTGGQSKSGIVIGCSFVGVALTAISIVLLLKFYAKMGKPTPGSSNSKVKNFLKEYADELPTRYSLSHLKKITNNFAEKLGEGGYGVVYRGKLWNGALVAVKILDRHRHSETQFMNEVATIGCRVHHFNLVRLLGYCFEGITSALVYEFMVNGSLDKVLFSRKEEEQVLSWEQLYSIALGAARGVAYLHQGCEKRIIHFDIKPHNILLDADFTPKVSDFGLAKLCGKGDDHISVTAARGTPGYVAPELCDSDLGPVTDKSDVYSFGMLLLEIVGGRKNINWKASRSSQLYFPELAFKLLETGKLWTRLRGGEGEIETEHEGKLGTRLRAGGEGEIQTEYEEKATRLAKIGLWCIQYNHRDRPCMRRVVQMLEGNGDVMTEPPFPFNSSLGATEKPSSSAAEDFSQLK